jgi:hypothetical protein
MRQYSWNNQNAEIFSRVDMTLWILCLWRTICRLGSLEGKIRFDQCQYRDPTQWYSWDDQNAETVDLVLWIFLLWGHFVEQEQFVYLEISTIKAGINQEQEWYQDVTILLRWSKLWDFFNCWYSYVDSLSTCWDQVWDHQDFMRFSRPRNHVKKV